MHIHTKTKIGIMVVLLIAVAVLLSANTGLFKGSLSNITSSQEDILTCRALTNGAIVDDFIFFSEKDIYGFGTSNRVFHWDGTNWKVVADGKVNQSLRITSNGRIYALGESGGKIWKSNGVGKGWSAVTTQGFVKDDFEFFNENKIYSFDRADSVWKWNGADWEKVADTTVSQALHVMPNGNIYAIGTNDGKIWKSNGVGKGWNLITTSGQIKDDFEFFAENDIYAFGTSNRIFHWDGKSWTLKTKENFLHKKLHVVKRNLIYALGIDGKIYKCAGENADFMPYVIGDYGSLRNLLPHNVQANNNDAFILINNAIVADFSTKFGRYGLEFVNDAVLEFVPDSQIVGGKNVFSTYKIVAKFSDPKFKGPNDLWIIGKEGMGSSSECGGRNDTAGGMTGESLSGRARDKGSISYSPGGAVNTRTGMYSSGGQGNYGSSFQQSVEVNNVRVGGKTYTASLTTNGRYVFQTHGFIDINTGAMGTSYSTSGNIFDGSTRSGEVMTVIGIGIARGQAINGGTGYPLTSQEVETMKKEQQKRGDYDEQQRTILEAMGEMTRTAEDSDDDDVSANAPGTNSPSTAPACDLAAGSGCGISTKDPLMRQFMDRRGITYNPVRAFVRNMGGGDIDPIDGGSNTFVDPCGGGSFVIFGDAGEDTMGRLQMLCQSEGNCTRSSGGSNIRGVPKIQTPTPPPRPVDPKGFR